MYGRDIVAPPGNQAANGEHKRQPVAMGVPGLLDRFPRSTRIDDITGFLVAEIFGFWQDKEDQNKGAFSSHANQYPIL